MSDQTQIYTRSQRLPGQSIEEWIEQELDKIANLTQQGGQMSPLSIDLDNLADGQVVAFDATNELWTNATITIPSNLPPPDADYGDITVSGGVWSIDAGVITTPAIADSQVTNTKMADMATDRIKGRNAGTTGAPEDLTPAEVTAMLNPFSGDSGSGGVQGLVPAPSAGDAAADKFLKADGTFAAPPALVIQRTLIESIDTSDGSSDWTSAVIDFATLKADGYKDLLIEFRDVSYNVAGIIDVKFSDDAGSTFPTGIYYGDTRAYGTGFTRTVYPDYIRTAATNSAGGVINGTILVLDAFEGAGAIKTVTMQTAQEGTTNQMAMYSGFIDGLDEIDRVFFDVTSTRTGDAGAINIYAR